MHRQFSARLLVVVCSAVLAVTGCKRKPEAAEVVVTLEQAPGSLSAATVLVDYSQASATPFRTGGEPACAAIVPNVTATFTDDGQGRITMHATTADGFSAPVDLAVCRMIPDEAGISAETISSSLRVSLLSGTDVAGKPVEEQRVARTATTRERATGGDSAAGSMRAHKEGSAAAPAQDPGEDDAEDRDREPAEQRMAAVPPPAPGQEAVPEATKPRSLLPERPENAPRDAAPPPADLGTGDDSGDDGDGAGREDSNEDTDTDPKAASYDVTIGVMNAAGPLGALQFNIVHHGEGGGFAGAHGSARCKPLVSALSTFNDEGNGTLRAGLIDVGGFDTPGPVVTCTFKSRGSVSSADFSIEVVDATDPSLNPQKPQMGVMNLVALGR